MKTLSQEIIDTLEGVLRVFEKGAFKFEIQKVDGEISCKVEYKNMAYRGQIAYDEDGIGVKWKFAPDFYPEAADEDDFLDLIFASIAEFN